jgi:hypothetical protein
MQDLDLPNVIKELDNSGRRERIPMTSRSLAAVAALNQVQLQPQKRTPCCRTR